MPRLGQCQSEPHGSDPENLRNAYFINSRAILEKPEFTHVDLHILMKITEMLLWVTLNGHWNFMNFSLFSRFQTIEKTKKTRIITFAQGLPLFVALGLHQCTWFFHWNLQRNSLKTHLRKTCISRIIAKTIEIATFRPPRIDIKTIWFFVFYQNNIASQYLWKIIKNMTSQKTF